LPCTLLESARTLLAHFHPLLPTYQESDAIFLVFEKLMSQHHDCFYKCQELFPAKHTSMSTTRLTVQMSRTLSCKTNKYVNASTDCTNVKNSFQQIIQMCQHHDRFYKCHELFPANHTRVKTMPVLTNDRSSFLKITCIKFDMDKELQLLT
jgi:hypothetical protein